ncbi:MAG: hypothetical protein AB1428_02300 [Bacteroidota bacterium]
MRHIILCCALLIAATASAQVGFGIHGDVTNLNAPAEMSDIYGLGYGGGVHLDVSAAIISFRLSADYVTIAPDRDKYTALIAKLAGQLASSFTLEGGRINIISGQANLKWALLPLPVISVYLTGGGGVARIGITETTVKFNGQPVGSIPKMNDETRALANGGVGTDIKLGGLTLFGEVRITWIFTEGETTSQVPIATVGITF